MGPDLYGVAIMLTIVTTAVAPPILTLSFRGDAEGVHGDSPPRKP